ncbi:RNA polymerase sigma factor [Chondrinema litorale]|uniref:RNA polymerase sigma factor n=1 Tax=Chondrinema litorale TaxID=2994555 RepID=UPI0025438411|nr:sigma-70 family RNA polymerase sigma factor [Chondrinema litorale]UZR97786.1 sigma-70 family RNA polymerase sigma factor [Chondrinema litorale]
MKKQQIIQDSESLQLSTHASQSISSYFEEKNEMEIWKEFKFGSEVALIAIYKHFYKSLYNYASQFTRDKELIKDAIQDLFIELIQKRKKLSDTSSIKYYLFKSVKTNITAKLKRKGRINLIDNLLNGYDFELSFSTEQHLINHQLTEDNKVKISQSLKMLTRKQKEIIYYFYFEGLNLKEISGLMDFTNQKSAQNLLYKSVKALRNKIK